MIRRPPRSTLTDTLFPYTTLFRSTAATLTTLLLAAAAFVGLLIYEPRRREPLLDLRFFRSLPFSSATVIAVCMFAGLGAFLFLNSLYLQEVRNLSAARVGVYLLRSEEHTSELQSLMRISYAVFCLKKKT